MDAGVTYHKCALAECPNQVAHHSGMRRKQEYCSVACKQKAYRQRVQVSLTQTTSKNNVTFWEQATTALDHLDTEQLHALKQLVEARLTPSLPEISLSPSPTTAKPKSTKPRKPPKKESPLLYYRKGAGVIHLSVNRMASFCGRDLANMSETEPSEDYTCQRCRHVRDTQTWWHGYRQAYGV